MVNVEEEAWEEECRVCGVRHCWSSLVRISRPDNITDNSVSSSGLTAIYLDFSEQEYEAEEERR
jgi:hypothetical protein